jgi:hypothetical protein
MKKYSNIAAIVILGIVAMMALAAVSCRRVPKANNVANSIDNGLANSISNSLDALGNTVSNSTSTNFTLGGLPDPEVTRPLLQEEITKATAKVKELKDDAVLQLVSMKFVDSLSDTAGLATNYYIFSSPTDTRYYYLVNVPHNGEQLKRFLIPKEDMELPFDLIAIPFTYWKQSYVDALKTAELGGGEAFRAKHTKFEVSAILGQPAGQYLYWFITYRATDGSGDLLQLSVDANKGTVQTNKQ